MTSATPAGPRRIDLRPTDTVVLINGPCIRALAWREWVPRYSARGYCVIASGAPVEARSDACNDWYTDSRGRAAAVAVTDYYERMLRTFPSPPILIGHCFGGVVVQLLLQRGLGAAGVAISIPPAPGRPRFRRANRSASATVEPFVDYDSRRRAPVLLVGGGQDYRVPSDLVAMATLKYLESDAVTGYLEYPNACHDAVRGPEWEHIADDVLDWAELYTVPGAAVRTVGRQG